MRERTLRTLPFNGVNWVVSLRGHVHFVPIFRSKHSVRWGRKGSRMSVHFYFTMLKKMMIALVFLDDIFLETLVLCSHYHHISSVETFTRAYWA